MKCGFISFSAPPGSFHCIAAAYLQFHKNEILKKSLYFCIAPQNCSLNAIYLSNSFARPIAQKNFFEAKIDRQGREKGEKKVIREIAKLSDERLSGQKGRGKERRCE